MKVTFNLIYQGILEIKLGSLLFNSIRTAPVHGMFIINCKCLFSTFTIKIPNHLALKYKWNNPIHRRSPSHTQSAENSFQQMWDNDKETIK